MSASVPAVVLVMAKAPVAGRVKTRLGRAVGMVQAAELAAAALLDTMAACVSAYGATRCHLALDGDLAQGVRSEELLAAAGGWTIHPQLGETFAERLVNAHRDTARASGAAVVQIGMDTPQVSVAPLRLAAERLRTPDAAVLGPAEDGGWWLLGVSGPHLLAHLDEVEMSTARTCAQTRAALVRAGAQISEIEALRDVDELDDAVHVAGFAAAGHFARALRRVGS